MGVHFSPPPLSTSQRFLEQVVSGPSKGKNVFSNPLEHTHFLFQEIKGLPIGVSTHHQPISYHTYSGLELAPKPTVTKFLLNFQVLTSIFFCFFLIIFRKKSKSFSSKSARPTTTFYFGIRMHYPWVF